MPKKNPDSFGVGVQGRRRPTLPPFRAVPSALTGLTILFGMGRCGPRRHGHLSLQYHVDIKNWDGACAVEEPHAVAATLCEGLRGARWASGRAISTARLHMSPCFHLRPIDVVFSHGPLKRSHLAAGFALICLQRLSHPDLATRRCPWRDNRCTSGRSGPVLSY